MSTTNQNNSRTDSPPLFNYLREEISLEELRDYASPRRIGSIDFVKGFAMIFIMLAHASSAWLDEEWYYIYGMVYAALDILGPSLFIFLSALSVIFSIKMKEGKIPEKALRNKIFARGATIIVIGAIYNLISIEATIGDVPFPLNLWGWNILMFIGFSQIFSYYALKLGKMPRLFVGLVIIFISPGLRETLYLNQDVNGLWWILHFIVTSPAPSVTLFPWLSICFISTIFGEALFEAMIRDTPEAYMKLFKTFLYAGIFMVLIGLYYGYNLVTPADLPGGRAEYTHLEVFIIMNKQDYYTFPGIPEFMIRGTVGNMFYNLGAALIIIAISFYIIDIKRKKNAFISMLKYYGKVSLSLFLLHYLFLPLYIGAFNIALYPFYILAFIGFMGFFMYIWMESGGKGSPEWFMVQISRIGQKTGEKVKEGGKIVAKRSKKVLSKTEDFLLKTSQSFKKEKKSEKRKKPQKDEE